MFKALFLTLGLLVSSPANAQEEPKVRGPVETVARRVWKVVKRVVC